MTNEELKNRAKELVEKHGKAAVDIAKRKADAFKSDCREKDSALMLLSEVEKLAESLFSRECKAPQVTSTILSHFQNFF